MQCIHSTESPHSDFNSVSKYAVKGFFLFKALQLYSDIIIYYLQANGFHLLIFLSFFIGAFLQNLVLAGCRRSYAVLYKEYMSAYNATATEVALVMTVQTIIISIVGMLKLSWFFKTAIPFQ